MEPKLPIEDIENLASTTECTGLTPAPIQTEEEGETYAQLYAIHTQKTAWEDDAGADSQPKNRKPK